MKFKEVEISLGMTLSPRQYESVRVDARCVVELGVASGGASDTDEVTDAFLAARQRIMEQVEQQMAQSLTRLGVGPPPEKKGPVLL